MNIKDSGGAVFDGHKATEKFLFVDQARRDLCWKGEILHRFAKLFEKRGLAHSAAMFHLKHLEEGSLLTSEEILQARVGKRKILHTPFEALLDRYRNKFNSPITVSRDTIHHSAA